MFHKARNKPLQLLLFSSIFAFLLAGQIVSKAYAGNATIKVGFVNSMTGPVSSLGVPYDKGMKAAVLYQSELAGHDIELITLDDESNPSKSARGARKLITENHVDILIGTAGTPGSLAMASVARDYKTPYISMAQARIPKDQDRSWIVNVPQPGSLMFDVLAKYMKSNGVKTIGFFGFSDASGDTFFNAIEDAAKKYGMKIVSDQRYARSDSSVTGQALKVISKNPDAIVDGATGTSGALPLLALKKYGYDGQVYGGHGLISSEFIKVGDDAVEGMVAPTGPVTVADQLPKDYPTRAMGIKFHEVYEEANGEPAADAFSSYSFDAWIIFLDAAQRAVEQAEPGTAEFRMVLRDALNSSEEVIGTHGVYNFSPDKVYGNDDRSAVIVKLEKGKWKLIESGVSH